MVARVPGVTVLADEGATRTAKRSVDIASPTGRGEDAIAGWLQSIGAHVRRRDAHIVAVSLASSSITDREMAILRELPQLEDLSLRNTEISDLGVAQLSSLRTLRALDVSHTLLSDSALEALAPLASLQSLDLSHTLIEGPGLRALAGLGGAPRARAHQHAAPRRWPCAPRKAHGNREGVAGVHGRHRRGHRTPGGAPAAHDAQSVRNRRRRRRAGNDRHVRRARGAAVEFHEVYQRRSQVDRRAESAEADRPVAYCDLERRHGRYRRSWRTSSRSSSITRRSATPGSHNSPVSPG